MKHPWLSESYVETLWINHLNLILKVFFAGASILQYILQDFSLICLYSLNWSFNEILYFNGFSTFLGGQKLFVLKRYPKF